MYSYTKKRRKHGTLSSSDANVPPNASTFRPPENVSSTLSGGVIRQCVLSCFNRRLPILSPSPFVRVGEDENKKHDGCSSEYRR